MRCEKAEEVLLELLELDVKNSSPSHNRGENGVLRQRGFLSDEERRAIQCGLIALRGARSSKRSRSAMHSQGE